MPFGGDLYIGSILLERNRWTTREPSYRVSEWLARFAQAGFAGVEHRPVVGELSARFGLSA